MNLETDYYINGVKAHDRRVLAKAITLIESSLPSHQEIARKIVNELLPLTGNAIRIGITGVPGVGKSTFIESLGVFLTDKGYKVAVLAIDPSSSRSGGSVLADKTRMEKLSTRKEAFIRPSPSSGTLGGVAKKTRETMLLCEAAGFEVIIVETVGVGQSETTVHSMVDFFLVLMLAGAGDELQGIKKGILELADTVVVNKADGDNVTNAEKARKTYETALHLIAPSTPTWTPLVLTCSALKMTGIRKIWEVIMNHRQKLSDSGELTAKRQEQAVTWMWTLVEDGLRERFFQSGIIKKQVPIYLHDIKKGNITPTYAAEKLLFLLDNT